MNATERALTLEEFVRDLNQDTRAIARIRFRAHGAAMLHAFQRKQAAMHNVMARFAGNFCNESNAASVVFELWLIEWK